ncbi:MAG: IclR family transcriptional regulator [Chelatococcus sp.]|jgi:DNA-binding IclR family transcriptional regulator|uniref:IclR family transcriptional regulator n=1 Tax=unclassified Chelatococcus TaxID=2638111 RepID=UPI001BD08307|nr:MULTISPECIES: IclR family transcriptional regulator [unclassified Chelatococcus]CAH1656655.1 putative IclR family transcriptional regulator [Hyphomicrobiales bacterium]MBS7742422.1 IclR family transcriptional regulator [Chelatococcus sp. HY11]MBX3539439.1 IclR family transcriptional regulator [Chelatococcus sp.]MBX3542460.1 IclR family transcriptional regulator [Chelatococcus sp.]MCO5075323.1 IclR family transcriptional regulator [Chelatococcus sp.]
MTRTGTAALERGLNLLLEVAQSDIGGATLTALVKRSGLPRSTVFRLLDCLVREGLLHKDISRTYHLGSKIYDLGLLASHRFDLSGYSFAVLRQLAETLGDTIFLNRRSGLDMVCIERIEGPNSRQPLTMSVGTRRAIGLGAGGLALLSALDAKEAEAVLKANHARYLAYYGTSLTAKLKHRVEIARRLGYAVNDGLKTRGVSGIGVGITSPDLVPILSLSVVAPMSRISQLGAAAIAKELTAASKEIAASLIDRNARSRDGHGSTSVSYSQ